MEDENKCCLANLERRLLEREGNESESESESESEWEISMKTTIMTFNYYYFEKKYLCECIIGSWIFIKMVFKDILGIF